MSFRARVTWLAAAGAVLLGLYFAAGALSPSGSAARASRRHLFPPFRADSVQRIELSAASSLLLERKAGRWVLEEPPRELPASQGRVDELLAEMAGLEQGDLVTRDPSAAASLGIGEAGSVSIQLKDSEGRVLAGVQTGTRGPGGQRIYLRSMSAPAVWLTGDALAPYAVVDRRFWADLRILPPDVSDSLIMRLSVEAFGPHAFSWTVTRGRDKRSGGLWEAAAGLRARLRQDAVDAIIGSVAGLVALDFAAPESRAGILSHPAARVTVSLVDNRSFTILFGEPDSDGDYPCALSEGDLSWIVPQWRERELVVSPQGITNGSR